MIRYLNRIFFAILMEHDKQGKISDAAEREKYRNVLSTTKNIFLINLSIYRDNFQTK